MSNDRTTAKLTLLGGAFFFSLTSPLVRYLGESFAPFFQSWTKSLGVLIALMIIGLQRRSFCKIKTRKDLRWSITIGLVKGLGYVPFFIAANHLPLATVMFVFYAVSVLTGYGLGMIFFQEKLTGIKIISLLLALTSLILVLDPTSFSIVTNSCLFFLLAGISGALFSMSSIFSKKASLHYSAVQVNTYGFLVEFIVSLVCFIILAEPANLDIFSLSWLQNCTLILVVLAATILTIVGYRRVTAQVGSLIMLAELLFVVIWGWLFFTETPSIIAIIGGLLIITSIALPNLSRPKIKHG